MLSHLRLIGMHLFASFFVVAALYSSTFAEAQSPTSLRAGELERFQWNSHEEYSRNLQETVVVIPILPIIAVIILMIRIRYHILHQHQKEANAAALRERQRQLSNVNEDSTPKVVTAAATKFSPNARAGIAFAGTDYAEITRILPDSIFHGSALSPGMKVVSINNISITSAKHASQIIGASKSIITILAHTAGYFGATENFVTATVCKQEPDQRVGVVYRKEEYSKVIRVKAYSETSLFLESDLAAGMEVVAINNVNVQTPTQAKELTQAAFPLLTILARRNSAVAVEVQPASSEMVVTAKATVLGADNNNNSIGEPLASEV